jgi:starch synthase
VLTAHSLEPMRPWKAEQLGGGYRVSSWVEKTAYEAADAVIAVSAGMREDILRSYPSVDPDRVKVVHNGIDSQLWRAERDEDVVRRHGVDPDRPSVIFVGRITRQKGLTYLLDAAPAIDEGAQLVLCAGAPDTPELAAEVGAKMAAVRASRGNVIWIEEMLPKAEVIQILSHATVFVCPSVYEPMGIVNLEAMACETAVVATAVGGIPEVVEDRVTGLLVPYEARSDGTGTPVDPVGMAVDLAGRINELLADPVRADAMGAAGRARAVERFGWDVAAAETLALYERLLASRPEAGSVGSRFCRLTS